MSTVLYTETVSSQTVNFNNFNQVIPVGTKNLYVKVSANPIGYQEIGKQSGPFNLKLAVNSSDAYGVDSGDDITSNILTAASTDFYVAPVRISNVQFVNSYGGITVG